MPTPDFDALDIQAQKRLNHRLDDDSRVSIAYRPALRNIIASFRVPRQYKTATASHKEAVRPSQSALIVMAVIAVALIVVFFAMPDMQPWCALGLMIDSFVAGAMCGRVRETQSTSIIPDPQQALMASEEDAFYQSLSPLIELTRSDVYHNEALLWLQATYSDTDSVQLRESIERLLKSFRCHFVPYSDAQADAFEVSTSNIPEIRTTRHAIVDSDGTAIVPGHVVFPQS